MGSQASKSTVDSEELLRQMEENPDVVLQYYESHHDEIGEYIENNFWEEDVEQWLVKIRQRSPDEALKVRKIDYLKAENGASNNTDLYENSALVVRRANSFKLKIYFGSRSFDQKKDDISFSFGLGKEPKEMNGTKIVCKVNDAPGPKEKWSVNSLPPSGESKVLLVQVNVPAKAIVAKYQMSVEITSGTKSGRQTSIFQGKTAIVLFNPFSQDDVVYMANEKERSEYVLNDTGIIYHGKIIDDKPDNIKEKIWDFAQFDEGILDIVLEMLKRDSRHENQPVKSWKKRHSPVYVSRALSAMVNFQDDNGILVNNWTGWYEGGKPPLSWTSSEPIMRKWKESGFKPVKFGQSFVFSGVLTTALRALGIPARSVTNFESAHDTNENLVIDRYYDADDGKVLDGSSDSVWDFHVWNEGYFKRPDLDQGFDGWQVVDGTPQTLSDTPDAEYFGTMIYQCGPAPVRAIKEGRIDVGFDANFIFAEVNADRVDWLVKDSKIVGIAKRQSRAIGKFISTKAVGCNTRHDITNEYKYPEGSQEERVAFQRAYGRGTGGNEFADDFSLVKPKFEIKFTEMEEVTFGKGMTVAAKVKNLTKFPSRARIRISACSKRYTGTSRSNIKSNDPYEVVINPDEEHEVSIKIDFEDYQNKLADGQLVTVRVTASDTNDGNTSMEEMDIQLVHPNCIFVEPPETLPVGKGTEIEIKIDNKLATAITDGLLEVFARGTKEGFMEFEIGKSIRAGESHIIKFVATPHPNWKKMFCSIIFTSKEIKDMSYNFRVPIKK